MKEKNSKDTKFLFVEDDIEKETNNNTDNESKFLFTDDNINIDILSRRNKILNKTKNYYLNKNKKQEDINTKDDNNKEYNNILIILSGLLILFPFASIFHREPAFENETILFSIAFTVKALGLFLINLVYKKKNILLSISFITLLIAYFILAFMIPYGEVDYSTKSIIRALICILSLFVGYLSTIIFIIYYFVKDYGEKKDKTI